MTRIPPADFPALLRHRRFELGFSQEALAERAGISTDAVSRYERGLRSVPRRETIALLVAALELSGESKADFENAAKRKYGSAISSVQQPADNLPWQPTSFIGRSRELEELSALLAPRRLVTVVGAGGIGKTRTAIEVAARLPSRPRDGAWFVDLSSVADGSLVLNKIASVLGVRTSDRDDALADLVAAIKTNELLLVVDNCEHLIDAVRSLAEAVLQGCPGVTLLATSRERLGISGEFAYQLNAFPVPAPGITTPTEARSYEALQLFVERALAVKHSLAIPEEHIEAAIDICRRLDGIALAIELAAARLPVLGFSGLQSQLAKHFRVLAGGERGRPARQQTLHATIAWSYDTLEERERILFRRLAVFANGWTLDAAEDVCADGVLERASVLDALFSLVEKSLVLANTDTTAMRYSFFESTREYALEQLLNSDEGAKLARNHATWMANFADRAFDAFGIEPRRELEASVMFELGNALVALDWALGREGDALLAGRIASGLTSFWMVAGFAHHAERYLEAALEQMDSEKHPAACGRLLLALSPFLTGQRRSEIALRAISLLEGGGSRRTLGRCYGSLAVGLARVEAYPEAQAASDRALAIFREEGLQQSAFYASELGSRASVFFLQGRLDEARAAASEGLSVATAIDDGWLISFCTTKLMSIEHMCGDAMRAVSLGEHAVATARKVGSGHLPSSLNNLACCYLTLGSADAAAACAREALSVARQLGYNAPSRHMAIQHLATEAALRGEYARASLLLGYVDAWFERLSYRRDLVDQKGYGLLIESLREAFSDAERAALLAKGARFTEEQAIDVALNNRAYVLAISGEPLGSPLR